MAIKNGNPGVMQLQLTLSEVERLIDAGEFVLAGPDPWNSTRAQLTLRKAVDHLKAFRDEAEKQGV